MAFVSHRAAGKASDINAYQRLLKKSSLKTFTSCCGHTPFRKVAFEHRTSKTDAGCPWCDLKHRTWLRDASESEATTGYQRVSEP
jgi:hypothetical protein